MLAREVFLPQERSIVRDADVAGVVLSMTCLKEPPTYSEGGYHHPQVLNYIEYSKSPSEFCCD